MQYATKYFSIKTNFRRDFVSNNSIAMVGGGGVEEG